MNKEIYVLGIGHNTPVYLDLVESCGYTIKGLYHYNDERVGELDHGYPIIGSFNDLFSLNSLEGMSFALSQGDNKMRATIFEKIVEVSKNLKKYNLTPDRMGCTDGGVQIYFEIVQVSLGNGNYEEKLRQVEPILKKLTELYPGKAGVLHLENYDAESESIPFVPAA